jgi:hypothetical protein
MDRSAALAGAAREGLERDVRPTRLARQDNACAARAASVSLAAGWRQPAEWQVPGRSPEKQWAARRPERPRYHAKRCLRLECPSPLCRGNGPVGHWRAVPGDRAAGISLPLRLPGKSRPVAGGGPPGPGLHSIPCRPLPAPCVILTPRCCRLERGGGHPAPACSVSSARDEFGVPLIHWLEGRGCCGGSFRLPAAI